MEKITDLRREVKARLTKKGVVDLTEYKLKSIDILGKPKAIEKALSNSFKKIGQGLISSILESDISKVDKVAKIRELIDNGIFDVDFEITEDISAKKLVKTFSKEVLGDETTIDVSLTMGESSLQCFTSLDYEPRATQEGSFYFRYASYKSISFISLSKLVGTVYFFNKLREYINTNNDMSKVLLLKFIDTNGTYLDRDHFEYVSSKLRELGYPCNGVARFLLKEQYSSKLVDGYLENGSFSYLEWNKPEDYFNDMKSIFDRINKINRFMGNMMKNPKLIAHFFNFLYELNVEEEIDVKEEINIATEYARSYETKKNIPDKILAKMKENKFLTQFGYVEFDELVDLEKIELIEKEWEDINNKILFPLAKDHSLRFRRLGKHKASGLYFPSMKAVCVDIKGPSSMVHEVFHMIDYTTLNNSCLSSMFNFRNIIERYRIITDEMVGELNDEAGFKSLWNGKTKYNKGYFHSAKEIFARCGELYVNEVLRIDSSLVKSSDKILYPKDEFLLELLEKYYTTIVQLVTEKEIETEVASVSISTEEIKLILKDNQINMFDILGVA